ncbi:mersacidin/lichenicidin family type 2 lantibiotic [Nostoc sp. CMAA1605]|uniref:mersacidin/lichenicidin family type 2 lantibiotic n=1 Tax=Nostoc sp. CMAA1605 TaxID=2055159 RepID=UPI001F21A696|nr:mersacidin/lichenicidin family type 2 lantibiotic [Nostoc sp. CMAA1605]MCF4970090.1 mersacidin/lichenicidin family type 2 lantibiotic [Nostoc sp. CMAA1605]
MSNNDIIRAWKNEEYRNSLSAEQLSQLPQNPAGMIELPNEVTQTLAGGAFTKATVCCIPTRAAFTCGRICDLGYEHSVN